MKSLVKESSFVYLIGQTNEKLNVSASRLQLGSEQTRSLLPVHFLFAMYYFYVIISSPHPLPSYDACNRPNLKLSLSPINCSKLSNNFRCVLSCKLHSTTKSKLPLPTLNTDQSTIKAHHHQLSIRIRTWPRHTAHTKSLNCALRHLHCVWNMIGSSLVEIYFVCNFMFLSRRSPEAEPCLCKSLDWKYHRNTNKILRLWRGTNGRYRFRCHQRDRAVVVQYYVDSLILWYLLGRDGVLLISFIGWKI